MKNKSLKILILIFSQGINTLLNFIFLPYLSRALSIIDYGTYGQALIVSNILVLFFGFGLSKVIYVYFADEKFNNQKVFNTNLISTLIFGSLAAIIIFPLVNYISGFLNNPELSLYILILLFSIPFSIAFLTISSTLIFFNRVKKMAEIIVYSNILKILLLFISIQFFESLTMVFISILLISIAQFLWSLFIVRDIFLIKTNDFCIDIFKKQIYYGSPLAITAVFGVLYKYTDSIMISRMLSVSEYAIYRNGAIEVPFMSTLYSSIGAIILPSISVLYKKVEFSKILLLKRRIINNTFSLIFPIFLFLAYFSDTLILTYFSEKYAESAIIFSVYCICLLVRINDYEDIMIAANKGNYILYIYVFSFVINLVLNLILINLYGSIGAAVSTVTTLIMIAFCSLFLSSRLLGHSMLDFFDNRFLLRTLFISSINFVVFLILFDFLFDLNIIFSLIIYLISLLIVIIRYETVEFNILKQLINKTPIFNEKILTLINYIKK